ncbi:MAG: hypothetical protein MJ229_02135 [bacterium]|nr:hypothetical protein [bacterium]
MTNLNINLNNNIYKTPTFSSKNKPENTNTAVQTSIQPENTAAQDKKNKRKTIIIASVGTVLSASLLALGGIKIIGANKDKISEKIINLESKAKELKEGKITKEKLSHTEKFFINKIDKIKTMGSLYNSAMNFISAKDILYKKITNPIPVVGKVCQKITDIVTNISVKMTEKTYKKTNKEFTKLFKSFEEANQKLSKTSKIKCNYNLKKAQNIFSENFDNDAVKKRLNKTQDSFINLDETIWEKSFKRFKDFIVDKKSYTTFIAERTMSANKATTSQDLTNITTKLSANKNTTTKALKNIFNNINTNINPLDVENQKLTESIIKSIDDYSKTGDKMYKISALEQIENLLTKTEEIKDKAPFQKIISSLYKDKSGSIDQLLKEYKKVLPAKDYEILEKKTNAALKSLNNSTDTEINKLYDKLRDLKIGSAPTDILTFITTFATVAFGIGKANGKEAKIQATLEYGIPALGAVAISSLCTVCLVSAGPSLIIGGLSGLLLNKIGSEAVNIRKKLHNAEAQNPTKTN